MRGTCHWMKPSTTKSFAAWECGMSQCAVGGCGNGSGRPTVASEPAGASLSGSSWPQDGVFFSIAFVAFLTKSRSRPAWCRSHMAQTILLVDDDPVVHWVLGQYLQRAGYQTVSAKTGREGLERATHDLPQLIILDVRMKEIDGVAVLKELKETPATKEIPVIMMTVRADRATRLNSQLLGADLFLTKPFS